MYVSKQTESSPGENYFNGKTLNTHCKQ